MAASKPAKTLPSRQNIEQTLYMAKCARGAMPTAVPLALPSKLAPSTKFPAAVLEVCVPCPLSSEGGGGIPLSLNEGCSGVIPVSSTPIITPLPEFEASHKPIFWCNPRKLGVCVVCNSSALWGRADTNPGFFSISFTSSADNIAANPLNTWR